MQKFRRHLEASFLQADPLRPRTPLYLKNRALIKESFEAFRQGMRKIEKFISGRSAHHLAEGCQQAGQALAKLRQLSRELSEEEAGFPRPETLVEELLASLDFLDQGILDPPIILTRVEDFRSRCRKVREDLAQWSKSKSKQEELGVPVQTTGRHLSEIEHLLETLVLHIKGERLCDGAEVKANLKRLGDQLKADHDEIMRIITPQVACPQCGQKNPASAKVCQSCAARLIQADLSEASTWSAIDETQQQPKPRFAYLMQVEEALESFLAGESEIADLHSITDWFAQRVQVGYERFKQMPPPRESTDPAQRAETEAIHTGFEQGSMALLSCARDMQRFLATLQRELLSHALDSLREGEKLMLDSHQRLNRSAAGGRG